jgi:hypothetical protein
MDAIHQRTTTKHYVAAPSTHFLYNGKASALQCIFLLASCSQFNCNMIMMMRNLTAVLLRVSGLQRCVLLRCAAADGGG